MRSGTTGWLVAMSADARKVRCKRNTRQLRIITSAVRTASTSEARYRHCSRAVGLCVSSGSGW
jgi:hypothetical protein